MMRFGLYLRAGNAFNELELSPNNQAASVVADLPINNPALKGVVVFKVSSILVNFSARVSLSNSTPTPGPDGYSRENQSFLHSPDL